MSDRNNRFPMATMDGNEAAAYVAYAFTEIAAIYPITPSSPMAGKTDAWSAHGKKNLFGQSVSLVEMQSEAGAVAAVHGALETGALATTFTSSQGLMLMIPVMHRISGERLPGVLHVASRTVGTHALSIFGDHSDVMNCRQTGFALLSTGSVQEIMDLAPVAHLAAIKGRIPFLHFFDGFRTSHEINKIETIPHEELGKLLDRNALDEFRAQALNPEHPKLRATVQNGDVYFQVREANNGFYDALPDIVEDYMQKIGELTGRNYHLFDYYGDPDATDVVVAMGSVSGTIREAVDALRKEGRKVGFVQVHLFRPFSVKHLMSALPESVRRIAVLDRCKEMGALGEPLYQDICTAFSGRSDVTIVGGRYGLSSKDTDPAQIVAVFDNLASETPKNSFSIGIIDDVTFRSLPIGAPVSEAGNTISCKFWGLGSDGTVGANKNTVEIINDHTDNYAQAYFEYDAKKSFGVTKSHLRVSPNPITASYYVKQADLVACHHQSYIGKYDMATELKAGGTFLLNCTWTAEELSENLPADVKRTLAQKQAKLYIINATEIASRLGLGSHTNTVLQAAFFHISSILDEDMAIGYMKDAVRKTYFAKGDAVVDRNIAAIDAGVAGVYRVDIPADWADAADDITPEDESKPAVVRNILEPINAQKGDDLPVSAFKGYEDGTIDLGLTAYEKRNIAAKVPVWNSTACLQCNRCSLVCPHAAIRPYLLTDDELAGAPNGLIAVPAKGGAAKGYHYTLQISTADCTGCGSCVTSCPAKEKAIEMVGNTFPITSPAWSYTLALDDKSDLFDRYTVKGSQFCRPLLEFSAACAGCGETPYAKLLTQLFGDRVYWANATGCSQAWGSPMPGIPYTTNKKGHGPAWSNSLFENNAEFSLGMFLSVRQQRAAQKMRVEQLATITDADVQTSARAWLDGFDDYDASPALTDALCDALIKARPAMKDEQAILADDILRYRDQLTKKCFWMFGGDGWAYDIGFGGLDHVVASGEDVNMFIVDTEVYSNTGGQSSKATPIGAVAQFANSGKKTLKKDLGAMLMTYGNVYVAQVAMGADPNQLMKALREAASYPGPSVIIAYTPCVSHGIKGGMSGVQAEMKRAVDAGYWHLYRYDPRADKPFTLDSGEATMSYREFLDGEVRYSALVRTFPDEAKTLFEQGEDAAKRKYENYKKM